MKPDNHASPARGPKWRLGFDVGFEQDPDNRGSRLGREVARARSVIWRVSLPYGRVAIGGAIKPQLDLSMHAPVRLGFVARQLFACSHDAPPYDDAFYIPTVKQFVGTRRGSRGGGVAEACDENHSGAPYVDFG